MQQRFLLFEVFGHGLGSLDVGRGNLFEEELAMATLFGQVEQAMRFVS